MQYEGNIALKPIYVYAEEIFLVVGNIWVMSYDVSRLCYAEQQTR